MSERMRFTVGSDPTEDDLIADLIYDDQSWGAITRRAEGYVLTLYPKRDGEWSLPSDDAIATMQRAAERLRALERATE